MTTKNRFGGKRRVSGYESPMAVDRKLTGMMGDVLDITTIAILESR